MSDPKYKDIGSADIRLQEEMGEVLKAKAKAERFGWFNRNPLKLMSKTNIDKLLAELDDLEKVLKDYRNSVLQIKKKG